VDDRLDVVEMTFKEFSESRDQWNSAVRRSIDRHVFLTWEWLWNWWNTWGHMNRFLLVALMDGSRIIAAAPLLHPKATSKLIGIGKTQFIGTVASDYHSFLLTQRDPEHVKVILDHLARRCGLIELNSVPEYSQTAQLLRAASHRSLRFEEKTTDECPYVPLPDNWDDYFRTLSSGFRREILRRERNLRRMNQLEFATCEKVEDVAEGMRSFFDLHQREWAAKQKRGIFSKQTDRDFHLGVASAFAKRRWLLIGLLKLGGETIAAQYNFKYANKLYCYLSGYAPEYSKYGLGSLLDMYLVKHCIDHGLSEYDFLRGDEPYKKRWNAVTRRNLRFSATRKGLLPMLRRWIIKAVDSVDTLRTWAVEH